MMKTISESRTLIRLLPCWKVINNFSVVTPKFLLLTLAFRAFTPDLPIFVFLFLMYLPYIPRK
jgi:hypothetical protein